MADDLVPSDNKSTEIQSLKWSPFSIDTFLFSIIIGFSVWVLLAQFHILIGWSFRSLFYSYLVWVIFQILIYLYLIFRHFSELIEILRKPENLVLLGLCMVGLFLATGWVRPDADDFNYIGGRIIYWIENPDKPLDLSYHNYALLPFSITYNMLFYQPFDLLCGFFAMAFNVEVLDAYHIVIPAFTGALIPLIWYMVIRCFVSSKSSVLFGVIAIMVYLCMDGTEHRTFGNFAFVRIWQGKAIYLSCCIPLFIGWTLRYFNNQSRLHFFRLFILSIATAGLTATTFPLTLFLMLMLVSGFILSEGVSKYTIKTTMKYYLAQTWLVLCGVYSILYFEKTSVNYLGFLEGFPKKLIPQYELVFGSGVSFTIIAVLISFMAVLILSDKKTRLLFIGWLTFGLLVLYNPWTMPFISRHFTSENIFWRLFYILPFPLSIGLAGAFIAARCKFYFISLFTFSIVCAVIVALYSYAFPIKSVFGKLPFRPFQHKIDKVIEEDVHFIISNTPPGPLLGPLRYRVHIPLFDNQRKMIFGRAWFVHLGGLRNKMVDLADSRLKAVNSTEASLPTILKDFEKALSDGVTNVVLDRNKMDNTIIRSALKKHHFVMRVSKPNFTIFVKDDVL